MFIKFPRYNYVGNPRPNRKEGGVGLLIKDSIKYKELHRSSKSELKSLIAELKDEKKTTVGALYILPKHKPLKIPSWVWQDTWEIQEVKHDYWTRL